MFSGKKKGNALGHKVHCNLNCKTLEMYLEKKVEITYLPTK